MMVLVVMLTIAILIATLACDNCDDGGDVHLDALCIQFRFCKGRPRPLHASLNRILSRIGNPEPSAASHLP